MSIAIFTDIAGHTITMKRLQYTISDSFTSDNNGIVKRGIRIDIQSWAKREEVNSYGAWSDNGGIITRNRIGTLTFSDDIGSSYMTIRNVYITSIEETSITWREWGQVNVSFQNEGMFNGDVGVMTFVGNGGSVEIYNSTLSIQPAVLRKNHMTVPHWNGSFYQDTGYDITRIQLSGVIPYDSCDFPESIISIFEYFDTKTGVRGNVLVPHEGSLSDFLPEVKNISANHIFIENASLFWSIERKIIQVNVSFVAPHQDLKDN